MSETLATAPALQAHTTVVNNLRITMNWFQSTFIVPSRAPNDEDFVAAVTFLKILGVPGSALSADSRFHELHTSNWEGGIHLPLPEERLHVMRAGFTYLSRHGILFAKQRFSATLGTHLA